MTRATDPPRIAVQVPIKARASTRIPGKNFAPLAGKPLAYWLLDELASEVAPRWPVYVDTEGEEVVERVKLRYGEQFFVHRRYAWFASDRANGNHLLSQFAVHHPEFDVYAQLYVTAVTLTGARIREALDTFVERLPEHDSMLLATEETGWYWFQGRPVNYDPRRADGLPRSQDATVLKETTGLYAATRDVVFGTGCRIGARPYFHLIPARHAHDVDTPEDLARAERDLRARAENGWS